MFGKIVYISDSSAHVRIEGSLSTNLMNMHVIFEDEDKKILGEIIDINEDEIKINFLGEFVGKKYLGGVIRKPTFKAKIRLITEDELKLIVGDDSSDTLNIGHSALYDNCDIRVKVNDLLSNHLAIFGNTGSGKSCGVARILQNIFRNDKLTPLRSNFLIFDAYGEYHNALKNISEIDPRLRFKFYTTNVNQEGGEILSIPVWLLNIDDMALLLSATTHGQLTIIERMLKLARIFATTDEGAKSYKNYLIAKAIMTILYSNQTASSKRNDVFSILNTCSTEEFNIEAPVQGIGYVRKFRECFLIDNNGNFSESVLLTKYVASFIKEELDNYEVNELNYYTLDDLENFSENMNQIPLKWYGLYLSNNKKRINEIYQKNDYEKLYEEMFQEESKILEELKKFSRVLITRNGMNLGCGEKILEQMNIGLYHMNQAKKIVNIEKFVNTEIIEVCIHTSKESDDKNILNPLPNQQNIIVLDAKECPHSKPSLTNILKGHKKKHCYYIKDIIRYILHGNFIDENNMNSIEEVQIQSRNKKIYKILLTYMNIVTEKIKNPIVNKNIFFFNVEVFPIPFSTFI